MNEYPDKIIIKKKKNNSNNPTKIVVRKKKIKNEEIFSNESVELTKLLDMKYKKEYGIYFSHPSYIIKCLKLIEKYILLKNINILEPSCGSCEFIRYINNNYQSNNIDAIELNKTIFDKIKTIIYSNNNVNIINNDFLEYKTDKKYNLIIGNPPFFVIKKDNLDNNYLKYIEGRPNIYIIFIIKSLLHLDRNGILCFILPKNFLNCLYYNLLRKHIFNNYNILQIEHNSDNKFIDTSQETIILIIQNSKSVNNDLFGIYFNDYMIFNDKNTILDIKNLIDNSTTLKNLGVKVNVGNIVWNQNKKILSDDSKYTRLIYNSDINSDNTLGIRNYKNKDKKNYIMKEGVTDCILILNRGYGKGNYNFNYSIINGDYKYLIENHVICINNSNINDKKDKTEFYKKIIKSFNLDKTKKFMKLYFGNNAVNTTELLNIIPIYLN